MLKRGKKRWGKWGKQVLVHINREHENEELKQSKKNNLYTIHTSKCCILSPGRDWYYSQSPSNKPVQFRPVTSHALTLGMWLCVYVSAWHWFYSQIVELFGSGPCGGGFSASWLTQSCLLTPLITAHLGARAQTNKSSPKQMPLPTAAPLEQISPLLQCVYTYTSVYVHAWEHMNSVHVYICVDYVLWEHSLKLKMLPSLIHHSLLIEWDLCEDNDGIMKFYIKTDSISARNMSRVDIKEDN